MAKFSISQGVKRLRESLTQSTAAQLRLELEKKLSLRQRAVPGGCPFCNAYGMIAPSVSPRKPQEFSAPPFGKVIRNVALTGPGRDSGAFLIPPPQANTLRSACANLVKLDRANPALPESAPLARPPTISPPPRSPPPGPAPANFSGASALL